MSARSPALTLILFFCLSSLCPGQDPVPPEETPQEVISLLMARIEQLERRVQELEGKWADELASSSEPSPQMTDPVSVAQPPPELMAEVVETYPSLELKGFTDISFETSDDPQAPRGFSEGQFVLHFSSALSRRWSFAAETALTAQSNEFRPSVERAILGYSYSDALKLSFGRYHAPVNWWNTEFHHGLWLQTTIDRPEMTRFGGEYLPVHFVGGLAEGAFPAEGLNLNYAVGIGNGRSTNLVGAGDAGDSNNERAWVANFFVRPDRWRHLQVGGAFYRDQVQGQSGAFFREWITSAHLVWSGEHPEIIAEFANVRHTPVAGAGSDVDNPAFYIQGAYRLPWRDGRLKPYYRYEYIRIDDADTVFRTVTGLKGSTLGFRYDLSLLVALKAEFRLFDRAREEERKAGLLQLSFTF